jgi:tetratricopeptide (TPR) repeat protein
MAWRYDEARKLHRETLEIRRRVLGQDHPDTLTSMHNLANAYSSQGRHDEAEKLCRETLEIRRRVLGQDHPDTLFSMHDLANTYYRQGRYDEAEKLHRETLEILQRVLGQDHPDTLWSMYNLANAYYSQGRYDEAEKLHRETLEIRRRVLGQDHPDTLFSMNSLAWLLLTHEPAGSRDPRTALQLALEVAERTGHKNLNYLDTLSLAYHLTGETAKAIENQKKAIALLPEGESAVRRELEEALAKYEAALEDGG